MNGPDSVDERVPYYGPGAPGRALAWGPAESYLRTARSAGFAAGCRGVLAYACTRRPVRRLRAAHRGFTIAGDRYDYPDASLATERRVEIPIACRFLDRSAAAERVLEVGRVLHPWSARRRDVVDLYEPGRGVLNVDIATFTPTERYDAIVSVSTLEHVGWDEPDQDLEKFDRTIRHLLDACLSERGRLLVTVPIGHHPRVDEFIARGHAGVGELHCMERVSVFNEWQETEPDRAIAAAGRRRYPGANGLAIWTLDRAAE